MSNRERISDLIEREMNDMRLQEVSVIATTSQDEAEVLAYTGTCQSCGRYLDVRWHYRCPDPCGGYIG